VKILNRKSFLIFPFLFSLYPVLALISNNIAEMNLSDGIRAMLLSFALTSLIYLILLFILKDPVKVALLTTLLLFLFFSYGHINTLTRSLIVANQSVGRHRILVPIYFLTLTGLTWLIIRTGKDLSFFPRYLNAFAIILLIIPIIQIVAHQANEYLIRLSADNSIDANTEVNLSSGQPRRDIYYILLDGYPRYDFIQEHLEADNSEFLEELASREFFIAHCSQSNYTDTRFSMASTLTMDYLDNGTGFPEVIHSGSLLDNMIFSNPVQRNFNDLGYMVITFDSGYKWLNWQDADLHLKPDTPRPMSYLTDIGINEFEHLLINTSAVKALIDFSVLMNPEYTNRLNELMDNPRETHRSRVFYSLEKLIEIPSTIKDPKFVYAHIILPHPPFIVDANGKSLANSPTDERSAYAAQIAYTNSKLIEIVDAIKNNSDPEPVIIIQSDHGATLDYKNLGISEELRLGILAAYYFPVSGDAGRNASDQLTTTFTPVNTFRLVFDRYFNGNYGQLEDRSIVGRQSPFTKLECIPPG
jgi:hypothetical protein